MVEHQLSQRIVTQCRDCAYITTSIRSGDGVRAGSGYADCPACGGQLAAFDSFWEEMAGGSPGVQKPPLTGVVFQVLLDAGGTMIKDELVAATDRSPHLVRETLQELADDGRIVRTASDGAWHVHLDPPGEPTPRASE